MEQNKDPMQRKYGPNPRDGEADDKAIKTLWKQMDTRKQSKEVSANFMQTIEGSHRFTLYGLIQEIKTLGWLIHNADSGECLRKVDHLLKGLQNAVDAGEDITKLI